MNPTLQADLYAKYPKIFRDRTKSPRESCMAWGINTGDGWHALIDHLCYALTWTYQTGVMDGETFVPVEPPQVVADQVKTKFATMRFYYRLEFDPAFEALCKVNPEACEIEKRYQSYFDGIVHMAESMSGRICEETGLPGELHVSGGTRFGWYATLNPEYAKTNAECVAREYVRVKDLPPEENA